LLDSQLEEVWKIMRREGGVRDREKEERILSLKSLEREREMKMKKIWPLWP
jgi:hypothetical protein